MNSKLSICCFLLALNSIWRVETQSRLPASISAQTGLDTGDTGAELLPQTSSGIASLYNGKDVIYQYSSSSPSSSSLSKRELSVSNYQNCLMKSAVLSGFFIFAVCPNAGSSNAVVEFNLDIRAETDRYSISTPLANLNAWLGISKNGYLGIATSLPPTSSEFSYQVLVFNAQNSASGSAEVIKSSGSSSSSNSDLIKNPSIQTAIIDRERSLMYFCTINDFSFSANTLSSNGCWKVDMAALSIRRTRLTSEIPTLGFTASSTLNFVAIASDGTIVSTVGQDIYYGSVKVSGTTASPSTDILYGPAVNSPNRFLRVTSGAIEIFTISDQTTSPSVLRWDLTSLGTVFSASIDPAGSVLFLLIKVRGESALNLYRYTVQDFLPASPPPASTSVTSSVSAAVTSAPAAVPSASVPGMVVTAVSVLKPVNSGTSSSPSRPAVATSTARISPSPPAPYSPHTSLVSTSMVSSPAPIVSSDVVEVVGDGGISNQRTKTDGAKSDLVGAPSTSLTSSSTQRRVLTTARSTSVVSTQSQQSLEALLSQPTTIAYIAAGVVFLVAATLFVSRYRRGGNGNRHRVYGNATLTDSGMSRVNLHKQSNNNNDITYTVQDQTAVEMTQATSILEDRQDMPF